MNDEIERYEEGRNVLIRIDEIEKRMRKIEHRLSAQESKNEEHDRKFLDIDTEWPLLNPEADDLNKAVKRKGTEEMGGKRSGAYQDKSLRQKVYQDIYGVIKRECGLAFHQSYRKIKRKFLKIAFEKVDEYIMPAALMEEVNNANDVWDGEE